jgi:hypothetical protein
LFFKHIFCNKLGKVKEKNENETLYGAISPPPKGATPPGEGELFWIVSPVLCFGWHGYYIGMDFFFLVMGTK